MKNKPKVTKVDNDESGDKKHRLVLPYKGDMGNHVLRSMEMHGRKLIPKKPNNVHWKECNFPI